MNHEHPAPAQEPAAADQRGMIRGGRRFRWITAAALATISVLALTACGDDDASGSDGASSEEQTEQPEQSDAPDAADEEITDEEIDAAQEAMDSLSLDTKAEAMATALDAESYEVVDESTVRFVLSSGSSENPTAQCIAAGAILDENVEITMVYPDGEAVC